MRWAPLVALAVLVMLAACNSTTESKDSSARFAMADSAFVYANSLMVELELGADVNATHVSFMLDEELVVTDLTPPFNWMWRLDEYAYGLHTLSATIYTSDGDLINVDPWSPRHTPMPFYSFYLGDWGGVTERDADGNLVGEVDARDWMLHSFGGDAGQRDAWVNNLWVASFNRVVTVHWSTAYEYGNAGFDVWRGESEDAWSNGDVIRLNGDDLIPGAIDSQTQLEYAWVDTFRVEFADYWYWVRAHDVDGECELFGPVAHSVSPWSPDLIDQIYPAWPNPAVDYANLIVELRQAGLNLTAAVVNSDGDVQDLLMRDEPLTYGRHSILWDSSAYTQQQLRIVFYFETAEADSAFWGYGDVYVQ